MHKYHSTCPFRTGDGLGKFGRSRTRHGCRFRLEPLEDRLVLSNYTITNVNYGGTGSLSVAIAAAISSDERSEWKGESRGLDAWPLRKGTESRAVPVRARQPSAVD